MNQGDASTLNSLRTTVQRYIAILAKKKASPASKTKAITSVLLPKVAYQLKFTTASRKHIDSSVAAPIRKALVQANHLGNFHNHIIFANKSHPAGLQFQDPLDYFLQQKEQMVLRALSGHSEAIQVMHSILYRAYAFHLGGCTLPSAHPKACPIFHSAPHSSTLTLPSWGSALVEQLQEGGKNLRVRCSPTVSACGATHTPLLDEILEDEDSSAISTFLTAADIYYVEELFPHPSFLTESASLLDHLPLMETLVPQGIYLFLSRVMRKYVNLAVSTTPITFGRTTMRQDMFIAITLNSHITSLRRIEQLDHSALLIPTLTWYPRWVSDPADPWAASCSASIPLPPPFDPKSPCDLRILYPPPQPYDQPPFSHYCFNAPANYIHAPSLLLPIEGPPRACLRALTCYDGTNPAGVACLALNALTLPQILTAPNPRSPFYTPRVLPLHPQFPTRILDHWHQPNSPSPLQAPAQVYSDGSFSPTTERLSSSYIISDDSTLPWHERNIVAHVIHSNSQPYASSYDGELVPITAIALLPGDRPIQIITDCKSLCDEFSKLKSSFYHSNLRDPLAESHLVEMDRDGSETGILKQALYQHCLIHTLFSQRLVQRDAH